MRPGLSIFCAAGLLGAALAIAGCGKKKTSVKETLSEGASITISGQLALENSSTAAALNFSDDVSLSGLKVYCVSFSTPPKAGTGTVDSSGSFSLSIDANGVAIGCFVLKGTETLATMTFEDTTSKDVNGEAKSDSRVALSGNTNLGKIALDTATGKAKASVSNFKNAVKTFIGSGFDFTGTWQLKATGNLPEGYITACPANTPENECRGPVDGMPVYLKRIAGKTVVDSKDAYAMAVWKSKTAFEKCGQKLGFRIEDAKSKVGIDFTSSGLPGEALVWEAGWEQGWKYSGAQTNYPLVNCNQTKINNIEVMKCTGTVNGQTAYQVNVNTRESGCKFDDGSLAKIEDWSQVQWDQGSHSCTSYPTISGLNQCTNKASYSGKTITCTHVGGILDANNNTVQGQFTPSEPYSGSCSGAPTELQRLRCYADYYFRTGREQNSDKCIADVQLNWGAQNADEFVMRSDGPARATSQFVMNLLNYSSESTASVRDEKSYFRGFPVKDASGFDSFVNCKVIESNNLSFTKISDTEMQMELITTEKSVDQNPQCSSQFGGELGSTEKMLFKAIKQ